MTEAEALLYNNILANLPTDYQIPSTDLNSLAENNIIKAILIQMEKDGYVQTFGRHADYSFSTTLLPPGIVFRNNGGYVQKRRVDLQNKLDEEIIEKKKINLERTKTFAAVASSVIALLALLFSIWLHNKTEDTLLEFRTRLEAIENNSKNNDIKPEKPNAPMDTIASDSNLKEQNK